MLEPNPPVRVQERPPGRDGAVGHGSDPAEARPLRHNGGVSSGQNPFVPSADDREPVRRFRGRLSAPVTIVTAGSGRTRAGLTVSSLVVIEGDPGVIHLVIGPLTDLWEVVVQTGRCVVHIAEAQHHGASDVFAGLRPSPGGPFASVDTVASEWGPVIAEMNNRAYCTVVAHREVGWSGIIETQVDRVELSERLEPLVHHRGTYRGLGPSL